MDYWLTTGREELYRSVEKTSTQNEGVAKNVLLFVGGGMGVSTVTASRIYKAREDWLQSKSALIRKKSLL